MFRSRSNALSLLAATLSVTLLAGCPNAGTGPSLPGDGKFTPMPTGSPTGTTPAASGATATPGAATGTPAPGGATATPRTGSPAPTNGTPRPTPTGTVNPPPSGETVLLQGTIFSEEGATVDGAKISVRSLDNRQPFTATAVSAAGAYVFNKVPVGVQVEVTVSKDNWTTRRRVTSLQLNTDKKNTMNFGAPLTTNDPADPTGAAYFISDFPEIASATPGASPIAGDKLSYKVRFSEPLDEDNQELVENSFIIDTAAAPVDLIPASTPALTRAARISIEEGSTFLAQREKTTLTWNAEGTEATITFNAPLRTLKTDEKSYRFRLVRRTGDNEIKDKQNKVLSGPNATTAVGDAYNAIKMANLVVQSTSTTAAARWDDTHLTSTSFDVKRDEVQPKLEKLETLRIVRSDRNNVAYRRIELHFTEPMRVYPDATGYPENVITYTNYQLAFGDDTDMNGVDMEDAPVTVDTDGAGASITQAMVDDETVIRFAAPTDTNDNDATNNVLIEPSETNAKVINIDIPENELPTTIKNVRVRVEVNVTDPAGNKVPDSNETAERTADNIKDGRI